MKLFLWTTPKMVWFQSLCSVHYAKKLNGSFKNPMDLDLFGVKCALYRIWPNVGDTGLGLSTMGFEFLLLNCSEERGEKSLSRASA